MNCRLIGSACHIDRNFHFAGTPRRRGATVNTVRAPNGRPPSPISQQPNRWSASPVFMGRRSMAAHGRLKPARLASRQGKTDRLLPRSYRSLSAEQLPCRLLLHRSAEWPSLAEARLLPAARFVPAPRRGAERCLGNALHRADRLGTLPRPLSSAPRTVHSAPARGGGCPASARSPSIGNRTARSGQTTASVD